MTDTASLEAITVSILGKETIAVGAGLTKWIADETVRTVNASNYIVVTDQNIAPLHLESMLQALRDSIAQTFSTVDESSRPRLHSYVMPPGESAKTRETKARIEDWALGLSCTRDSCFIALGGGVIGDLVGYVAATFMRGAKCVQVPTTLLAMVDSSIGGKTAIDVPAGKNLIGAFHQPARIFIDIHYLKTLPRREFVNGLAEIIKTAAIWSEEDFSLLENHPDMILALSNGITSSEEMQLLLRVILGSVRVKAHVVTSDEKEGGLRGLLNFGHTVGHAIEAILSPQLLHGECVAMGMVREAEISRHLGHLNDVSVGRLIRCLQAYGLPISTDDKVVRKRAPKKRCPVDRLMEIMKVDKKNQGDRKRLVLLAAIGRTVEPRASFVEDKVIQRILSPSVAVFPAPSANIPGKINLKVPGSKSISNRALVMAALGEGPCRLHGLLHSDDVQVMLDALQKLMGIAYEWENDGEILLIQGGGGRLRVPTQQVYLGNAGTAARFLTTVCALVPTPDSNGSTTIVTGNARMKQRPISALVDALLANGVQIKYLENSGSLPLEITPNGRGLPGGDIQLSATVSSQYVSSILISAPYAVNPVVLDLGEDKVISQPYIDMTVSMMEAFGIHVQRVSGTNKYLIPKGVYQNPPNYYVEADASSATYPLAYAAITGKEVTVTNIGSKSLQGDAQFAVKVLAAMGATVSQTEGTTTVVGPAQLKPITAIDMETMTDAFLTASILAAVAQNPTGDSITRITGIANQRVKECNRIAVMVEQLAKFGVSANELPDGIAINGIDRECLTVPDGGIHCYDDHRVAMSFSVLASAMPTGMHAVITEKKCVEKTWPGWWDTLYNKLGVNLTGEDTDVHDKERSGIPEAQEGSVQFYDDSTMVFIGMRGAGKTHAGKAAAVAFSRQFIDMDAYLEHALGVTIPTFIETRGWEAFRKQETLYLKEVLEKHPKGAVIACGGGIVETDSSRELLQRWAGLHGDKKQGNVIHIKRNITDVTEYLSQDTTRPMYGEDMNIVWNRRKQWYADCSNYEFSIVHSTSPDWAKVEVDLIRFLKHIARTEVPVPDSDQAHFFVSLTHSNVLDALPVLQDIAEGVDALELRVDLLASHEIDFVGTQLAHVRRHSILPIIFTVRTKSQGGQFSDESHEERRDLLRAAIRWGCEYVDVELDAPESHLQELVEMKGNAKIIASYHDISGLAVWDDSIQESKLNSGLSGPQFGQQQSNAILFRDKYLKAHAVGDIIKLIGRAQSLEDNFSLQQFVQKTVAYLDVAPKPLIALNMGPLGRISRALNTYLTPVTHPALPMAAAPGQLSVKEINEFRQILGVLPTKKYYLFGKPISQSVSPALHNAGFRQLGLPHEYELAESASWEWVRDLIDSGLADGTFGGASVTVPLKVDVVRHGIVKQLSQSARGIGAVNTLIVGTDQVIRGDNTDWLGIKSALEDRLLGSEHSRKIGVVIGAGGTARAALYALKQMGVDEIRIWNRTLEKAQQLASEFGCTAHDELRATFANDVSNAVFLLVGTIPAAAQQSIGLDSVFTSLDPNSRGVLVEMAYRPRQTPLVENVGKLKNWTIAEGIDILCEQGYEQFERWTKLRAPKNSMRNAAYSAYGN